MSLAMIRDEQPARGAAGAGRVGATNIIVEHGTVAWWQQHYVGGIMSEQEYTQFKVLLRLAEQIAENNKQSPANQPQAMVIFRIPGGKWAVTLREGTQDLPLPRDGKPNLLDALEEFVLNPRKKA